MEIRRLIGQGRIFREIGGFIGREAAAAVQEVIKDAYLQKGNVLATGIGILLFLLGATAVFSQLKNALNDIWSVAVSPKAGSILNFLKTRLLAITMLISFGFLLLVSLILSAALAAFGDLFSFYLLVPGWLLPTLNGAFSIVTISVFFALVFKMLPDVKLSWRDVRIPAVGTSILFTAGKAGMALYLAHSTVASVFGAAGSVAAIMIWVYYSSLILFFGATATRVLAEQRGRKVAPVHGAVRVKHLFLDDNK